MSKKLIYLISLVLLLGVAGNASAWINQDIGSPNLPGSASYDSTTGTWTVVGDGSDIWGTSDQFHYVYCPLWGDGVITARIVSMDMTDAKAGVMIRETLDAGSKHAMMAMTGTNGVQMVWRENTGGGSSGSGTASPTPPWWLRIERIGDQLRGYHSNDGVTWILQNTVFIPMNPMVYIGMAVTSRNSNQLCTAVFDNVTATVDCTAASNPSPPDGAVCVDPNVVLSWSPGCLAEAHNVYFGLDPGALALVATIPLGDESYDPPGDLEPGTTYYWRIDEVCGVDVCEGEVWSFTIAGGPCECLSIRVSQESSPGLGDFDENVLGCIKVFETADSAKDYYAYDTCGDSFGNLDFINTHGLIEARSHLFLVCGCDVLSLFIVHDKPYCAPGPNDANGGRAEMRFGLLGGPGGAKRTVEDDPSPYDAYTPALNVSGTTFSSQQEWFVGRTDGQAITGLDGEGWSMLVEFTEYDSNPATPVIEGLNSWFAYSEDGSTIELALEADRRVRLDCCIPECDILEYKCKADVKWSQPPRQYKPDPTYINGWDEVSSYDNSPIVADDWLCKDEQPIKGIHWWGSFKGWTECVPPEKMPDAFHIGIWTDVPDPNLNDPYTFSHPDELVWEKVSDCYVWSFAGYDLDPRGIDQNDACFKFDQLLSQDEWFYQNPNDDDGTVYWLSIAAIYDDGSASCRLVDDFESYTDTPDLLNAWQALGSASLFLSEDPNPHHWGKQAMGFIYDNNTSPYYSEACRTYSILQDWTSGGVKRLSLWFKGETYNSAEQMYVALEDTVYNVGVVKHPDTDAVRKDSWQQWCIDLADSNFAPVNMTNINKLYIGFGDRDNPVHGGWGTIYIDDIRLCNECPNEPNFPFPWGWKTRPHFYSDDAVHIVTLDGGEWPPAIGSLWESGEPIQYPEGTSWDMAFVLTANRKYRPRRWRWPHKSWTVKEELMAVDIYEDGRIDFKDLAVSANHWLEEAVWP